MRKMPISGLLLVPVLLLAVFAVEDRDDPAAAKPPDRAKGDHDELRDDRKRDERGKGPGGPEAPPPTDSSSPADFTHVDDILAGRRTLFPVDDLLIDYQNENQTIASTSASTSGGRIADSNAASFCGVGSTVGYVSGIGRMFDRPHAVEIMVSGNRVGITEMNDMDGESCGSSNDVPTPHPGSIEPRQFPQGDLTGDGFDDFAVLVDGTPYVLTARDVSHVTPDLLWSDGGTPLPSGHVAALAAGDLDGDGVAELAVISADPGSTPGILEVTVYDARVTSSGGQQQAVSLEAAGSAQIAAPDGLCVADIRGTAGTYSGTTNPDNGLFEDELFIAYQMGVPLDGTCIGDYLVLATLDATTSASGPSTLDLSLQDQQQYSPAGTTLNELDNVSLTSARIDYFSPTEQVVIGQSDTCGQCTANNSISIVAMGPDLRIPTPQSVTYGFTDIIGSDPANLFAFNQTDVVVGNLGQESDPDKPLALNIAAVGWPSLGQRPVVVYIEVDPTDFSMTKPDTDSVTVLPDATDVDPSTPMTMSAGDLQGRSMLLGEPTKTTVQHGQPRLVLASPPQHVDWVQPADDGSGSTDPEVLNLGAVPASFFSTYELSQDESVSSTTKSTTSVTHAAKVEVSAGYSYGNAATGTASVTATASSGYMHDKTVAKVHDTSATDTTSVTVNTGFDDSVWFTHERHNIYAYPVIGQTVCPDDKPGCSQSERVPLILLLSGPDQVRNAETSGSTLEWYQPLWEPGNIFSYPGNLTQLGATYEHVDTLSSDVPNEITTDSTSVREFATWTVNDGKTATSGTNNNIDWGASLSVSYSPPKETGGPSASAKASYNGSKAISSLNTSTTSVGESVGIGINKPGTFPDPAQYKYGFSPYIFGDGPTDAASHSGLLKKCTGTVTTDCVDNLTQGVQQVAFTADPEAGGAGGAWWATAYPRPDLALNHPARWNVTSVSRDAGANCIATGNSTTTSCATFNERDDDLWRWDALWMKGLLITPASTPAEGPQITQTTAGDRVRLQSRVYNYSPTAMEPGTTTTVQFYGQPWDPTTNTPAGDSFLIENVVLGPIPGFDADRPTGNWAVAETTALDTAAHANQHLVFWVMVVGKDSDGAPLAEMAGHGITGIPPTQTSIPAAAGWLEPHSNNLGYFHSVFFVAPADTASVGVTEPGAPEGSLRLKRFGVRPRSTRVDEKVEVRVELHAGDQALDGVGLSFYDGDPENGGTLIDHEVIAHIRANEMVEARVPYRPATCGVHRLYVEAHPQGKTAEATFNVRKQPASGGRCRADHHAPPRPEPSWSHGGGRWLPIWSWWSQRPPALPWWPHRLTTLPWFWFRP